MKTTHLVLVKKALLTRTVGKHMQFARFTAKGDTVRVLGYGTAHDYTNDQTVTREEARTAWKSLVASGYKRAPAFEVLPWH